MKTSGSAFSASQKLEILADTIGEILGTSGTVRINNSRDHDRQPLSPHAISEKAKKMYRDKAPIDYNLLGSNCEHYMNLSRCDYPTSAQITAAGMAVLKYILAIGV
ncbi:phospholipase A and acyltransferase 4-like [Patiria miniata]|uniref:LRAT domain-containing protein n=1 Tax=Patiria miniata TaxID=46514 RepID=A0A914ADI7_PATMI|nr:phospholipase A and acyltransferase 4-like [Patiria miniata]